MKQNPRHPFPHALAWLLFPFTIWYGVGVFFRNLLFDIGVLKERTMPVTTIGVGNIATGGTGKTPVVEYLLDMLSQSYSTAFLSRGYRRSTKGFLLADDNSDPVALGDEAAMVAATYPSVKVAVCERRVAGVQRLLESEEPPQVVVLDDVYQHRYIKPTVSILLTEYSRLYTDDYILPFGNLREFRRASRRANIVVITKSPLSPKPMELHAIVSSLQLRPYQKLFFNSIVYDDAVSLDGTRTLPVAQMRYVLAVTGIANPAPMIQYLRATCKVTSLEFPDHHAFTDEDIELIRQRYSEIKDQGAVILTTQKDAMRLRIPALVEALADLPVYYLPIHIVFHKNKYGDTFDSTILNRVKENVFFQQRVGIAPQA